ncbi:hypothetical protein [Methanolobus profundi]|uniref:Uncharacterized protein n=1 Tax=Methanolobus profundi TaxID=487685 RepID=A0A1I4SVD2_9EURY|nr:hypothetical protein [Methanolobus profundi]SFM68488.1 hypothetical protein SAMN04488696_2039 [Methanolobus profundi]
MSDWITYYEDNKLSALKRIKNMALSPGYRKELSCWVNKYLDPFSVARTISIERKESLDPYSRIRMEAERDLEFTLLTATGKDRNSSDIILFESNLLLLFNLMLKHIRAA